MRRACAALTALMVVSVAVSCSSPKRSHKSDPMPATAAKAPDPLAKLHWRLGMQAWTFRKLTLFETIDMCKRLDVHYLEMYPGQKLAPDSDVKADHNLPDEQIEKLLAKCKESGVTPVSYGVCDVGADEKSARKVFDFAKKMGLEQIVAEPVPTIAATVDNLATEYGIKLAIHDHPKPSRYWNPDTVLLFCQGRSERIGSCSDVGHWVRSGLVAVECMKKLEGRIIEFHMKDIDEKNEDVIWGTGRVDVRGVMEEAKRQNLRNPLFAIEYERTEGEELVSNVSRSIEYFKKTAAELAAH
jgi:sugar phosphate isomerase/epimerase